MQAIFAKSWRRNCALLVLLAIIALGAKAWHDTAADPVIMRADVVLADYPASSPPVTIALLADIHVAGPDMPPSRLVRIVEQVNALRPDYVLIAGDFTSDKWPSTRRYSAAEAIAPLAALDPAIAAIAVPGNHDHWRSLPAIRSALQAAGIELLANEAQTFGPLAIGGLDDDYTRRADVAGTLAKLDQLPGARIILTHSPDPFPDIPASAGLVLAGHTHCGQIAWPWGGSPATMSRYGQRYACGRVDEAGKVLITSGGLGTSLLPLRLFTRPEIWLIRISGAAR